MPLPAGLRLQRLESIVVPRRGRGGEAVLDHAQLVSPSGSVNLLVAYRGGVTPRDVLLAKPLLLRASERLRLRGGPSVLLPALATDVASRSVVELCAREGLVLLDKTGTIVAHQGPLFVHVVGESRVRRDKTPRVFAGRARRIVRLLLTQPQRRFHVRDVVAATEVSHSFAFRVLEQLERGGYLERRSPRSGYGLRDGLGLLRAWASAPGAEASTIGRYFAPSTRPEVLARAAAEAGVQILFTLASGLKDEEVFVAGLPHGAHVGGDDGVFRAALGLQDTTPHNFWIFHGDPAADAGPAGVALGARDLPYGRGVALPQLAVDLSSVPGRGAEAVEAVATAYARDLPLLEGDA